MKTPAPAFIIAVVAAPAAGAHAARRDTLPGFNGVAFGATLA